jgi:hypothetical protein
MRNLMDAPKIPRMICRAPGGGYAVSSLFPLPGGDARKARNEARSMALTGRCLASLVEVISELSHLAGVPGLLIPCVASSNAIMSRLSSV